MSAVCCPVHPEQELREEYHTDGRTGYCALCPKHYKLCTSVQYMAICTQLKGHPGQHCAANGNSW